MRGSASACLLTLGASIAAGVSCVHEPSGATLDLLARSPDQGEDAAGVHADLAGRLVRLEPGAEVRYRIEPRVPGEVRLTARAAGQGTLEGSWFTIDLAAGTGTPGGDWKLEGAWPGESVFVLGLPSGKDLLELRLAWRAPPGAGQLELSELALHESAPAERPSIVLIVIDTLSARHLSAYGYPLETDPELKRFASESFLFERCYSNATWTVPSFMSLMTGLYARAHELRPTGTNLWELWYLAQNRWTLAEALRAAGYRTAGFVDNGFLSQAFGFAQGFDVYDESAAADNDAYSSNPDGGFRQTTALARAFLRALDRDAPSFTFVHAFDVHQPYTEKPPVEKRSRGVEPYDRAQRAPVGGTGWTFDIIPTLVARVTVPEGELPQEMQTAPIARAYDEGVRFLDEELGKLFADLRVSGALERSWVIFTADHGETMADDVHYFGHGLLSQDVVHVPLVIRPPGGCPGGKRIGEVVQLADLYPTLLELAGLGEREAHLHGRSLVPLLRNGTREPDVVLSESGITRQAMLVADGWKLVELEPTKDCPPEARISHPLLLQNFPPPAELEVMPRKARKNRLDWLDDLELRRDFFERMPAQGLTEELLAKMQAREGFRSFLRFIDRRLKGPFYALYDLAADPQGKHDVAAQYPEKVVAMKALLRQEQRRRNHAWKLARPPAKPVELPPEEIRALEALGYGGGGDYGDDEDDEDEDEDDNDESDDHGE